MTGKPKSFIVKRLREDTRKHNKAHITKIDGEFEEVLETVVQASKGEQTLSAENKHDL